eukprot:1386364-Lingulodinium_polyedra.AAC.1
MPGGDAGWPGENLRTYQARLAAAGPTGIGGGPKRTQQVARTLVNGRTVQTGIEGYVGPARTLRRCICVRGACQHDPLGPGLQPHGLG